MKRKDVLARLALALADAVKHVEAIQMAILMGLPQQRIVDQFSYLRTLLCVIQLALETLLVDEAG